MTHLLRLLVATFSLAAALTFGALALGQARTLPPLVVADQLAAQHHMLDVARGQQHALPPVEWEAIPAPIGEHTLRRLGGGSSIDLFLDDQLLFNATALDATWSADGSAFSVTMVPHRTAAPRLYIMRPGDAAPTFIAEYDGGLVAQWSADGTHLAYAERVSPDRAVLYLTDGGTPRVIARNLVLPWAFEWSSTAHTLAYVTNTGEAVRYEADFHLPEVLPYTDVRSVMWSPDGAHLLVSHRYDDKMSLSLHGSGLLDLPGEPVRWGFSPNGRWVAVRYVGQTVPARLVVVDAGASPPEIVTTLDPRGGIGGLWWSADSRFLAYDIRRNRRSAMQVALFDRETARVFTRPFPEDREVMGVGH